VGNINVFANGSQLKRRGRRIAIASRDLRPSPLSRVRTSPEYLSSFNKGRIKLQASSHTVEASSGRRGCSLALEMVDILLTRHKWRWQYGAITHGL